MEADIPWLVVPTYNEVENLQALVQAATKTLRKASPEGFAMLIVDDNSPDGTGELADRLAAERDELRVLHRPGKGGLGPAYLAGFAEALAGGAGYVLEMDADFSHDPEDLGRLLDAARDGADLVLVSRYVPGGGVRDWGVVRRLISWASSRKKGRPAKWSPCRWLTSTVEMALGSTCHLRIATIEEAPQSISTLPWAVRSRWKQVLKRPPLPKASPETRNVRRIEDRVTPSEARGL